MTEYTINSDGYTYESKPLEQYTGLQAGVMEFYLHFARAFEKAEKEWDDKQKSDPSLVYFDTFYVDSMVLACDGAPVALVKSVDDMVQVFQFSNGARIEESK